MIPVGQVNLFLLEVALDFGEGFQWQILQARKVSIPFKSKKMLILQ